MFKPKAGPVSPEDKKQFKIAGATLMFAALLAGKACSDIHTRQAEAQASMAERTASCDTVGSIDRVACRRSRVNF